MAARTVKTTLNDNWREKIQTSMLMNRLSDHALKKTKLSVTQLRAAEILLARTAPVLTATELTTINPNDNLSESEILLKISQLLDDHPDLLQRALAAKARAAIEPITVADKVSASDA